LDSGVKLITPKSNTSFIENFFREVKMICLLFAYLLLAFSSAIILYIDPGTGSLIFQILSAIAIAILFYFSRLKNALVKLFKKTLNFLSRKNETSSVSLLGKNFYLCTKANPLNIKHGEPRILWISAPAFVKQIQQYRPHLVVYDALDEPADEFASWAPYVERLRAIADLIFATAHKIFESNRRYHPNVHLCPNGVDYEHFSQVQHGNLVRPVDLPADGRPVIGYCGALATWLDWELLDYLTEVNPGMNFVFVGPLYNTNLPFQKSNMKIIGYRDYKWLPNYLQHFDVCIIPFKVTPMTESCNPIKLYEYLSTGKQVVSTPLPEVLSFPEVYIGRDPQEFNVMLQQALFNDSPEARSRRIRCARENSWQARVQQAKIIIEKTLREKGWII